MLAAIGDKCAVILRNHGLLTIGRTLPETLATMYTLQRARDVQIAASAAGAINPISAAAIEQSVDEFLGNEPHACELLFDAMVRLVGAKESDFRN